MVRTRPSRHTLHTGQLTGSVDLAFQARCSTCNSAVVEFDSAQGQSYCAGCGTVLEENEIVSEITFGESSGGAAIVQGSFVAADARTLFFFFFLRVNLAASSNFKQWLICLNVLTISTVRTRASGPYGNRGSAESREVAIANGASIRQPASELKVHHTLYLL
jgi:transcription factor IIIB subunit 2